MSGTLSWADANAACQAAGLQLASVQSAAQNALLLTAAGGHEVWIGGTDAASEGAWAWSPSNTPLSYTNWNANQPDNWAPAGYWGSNFPGGNENCLMMNHAVHLPGKWNDAPCTVPLRYVCQPIP